MEIDQEACIVFLRHGAESAKTSTVVSSCWQTAAGARRTLALPENFPQPVFAAYEMAIGSLQNIHLYRSTHTASADAVRMPPRWQT
jgi:hypothetical protein